MDFPIALDYIRLGMRCLMDIVQVFAHSGLSACRSGSMKIRPKSVFLGRACIALAGAGGVRYRDAAPYRQDRREIRFSDGAGSEAMKRIAAPWLPLFVIPALYWAWQERRDRSVPEQD